MTREQYESLPLSELKEIAKARGMKGTSALKKGDLINRMLEKDEENGAQKEPEKRERKSPQENRQEQRERSVRPRICLSWTAGRWQTASWRYWQTGTALFGAPIICRVKTTFTSIRP